MFSCLRFRSILEGILKLNEEGLIEGLKVLIESSNSRLSNCISFHYLNLDLLILVVHENVSLVISRQILSEIGAYLPKLNDESGKSVCGFALAKIQPRVISFEEQVAAIRQHLADIYEREQLWKEAANVLVGIPLETGQKYPSLRLILSFPDSTSLIFILAGSTHWTTSWRHT